MREQQNKEYQNSVDMMMSMRDGVIQFCGIPAQDSPVYIEILVNPTEKRLCVLRSNERSKEALALKTRAIHPEIFYIDRCAEFLRRMYDMMGWNNNLNYLLKGFFTNWPSDAAWTFKLSKAEAMLAVSYETPKMPGHAPDDWVKGMVAHE